MCLRTKTEREKKKEREREGKREGNQKETEEKREGKRERKREEKEGGREEANEYFWFKKCDIINNCSENRYTGTGLQFFKLVPVPVQKSGSVSCLPGIRG